MFYTRTQQNTHILMTLALIATLVLVAVLNTHTAFAAFNEQINYQGKLNYTSGEAVTDTSFNMRFKLYTVSTGGTAVYTETWCYSPDSGTTCDGTGTDNRIAIDGGLFSTMIGSTAALTGVNFDQTLYLGVEIGGADTVSPTWDGEMTPRKIFGAVPAAFEAKQLGGVASSSFLRSDEPATIASSTTSTLLTINQIGTGDLLNLLDGGTEVLTVLDGGNVGIGTSTPTETLFVSGTFLVTSSTTFNGVEYLFPSADGSSGQVLSTNASGGLSWTQGSQWTTSGSDIYYTTGNIGIGTTTPSSILHLNDADPAIIFDTTTASDTDFWLGVIEDAGGDDDDIFQIGDGLTVGTNPFLTIDTSGNVGIGTASPATTLEVEATTRPRIMLDDGSTQKFRIGGNDDGVFFLSNNIDYNGSSWNLDNTSAEGILALLRNDGSNSGFEIITAPAAANPATLTSRFIVKDTGLVGIGDSTPSYLLDVAGAGRFTGLVDASYLIATSTTATSTFAGVLSVGSTTPFGSALFSVGTSSPLLHVDRTTGFVGIGTSNPSGTLEVGSGQLVVQPNIATPSIAGSSDLATGLGFHASYLSFTANGVAKILLHEDTSRGLLLSSDMPLSWISTTNALLSAPDIYLDRTAASVLTLSSDQSTGAADLIVNGKIGIGTTSPYAKLSVHARNGDTNTTLFAIASSTASATTTHFVVDNEGNVGIGTAAPAEALDIHTIDPLISFRDTNGGGGATGLQFENSAGTLIGYFQQDSGQGDFHLWSIISGTLAYFEGNTTRHIGLGGDTTPDAHLEVSALGTTGGNIFLLSSNSNTDGDLLTVTEAGLVGIGTTTPNNLLQINGGGGAQLVLSDPSGGTDLKHFYASSTAGALTFGGLNDSLSTYTERFRIDASGNVGIATTTPVSTLSVQGSLCVRDTGTCGTTAGTIYATTATITDIDLAENFTSTDPTLRPGEIVMIDPDNEEHILRAERGQVTNFPFVGVISTDPGLVLGSGIQNSFPVALAGRVPVQVNDKNGLVEIGDRITLSSVPGVGRRAESNETSVAIAFSNAVEAGQTSVIALVENDRREDTSLSLFGAGVESLRTALASVGVIITDTMVRIKNMVAEQLTVGSQEKPTGITLYDELTGEPYCFSISGGRNKTRFGACKNDDDLNNETENTTTTNTNSDEVAGDTTSEAGDDSSGDEENTNTSTTTDSVSENTDSTRDDSTDDSTNTEEDADTTQANEDTAEDTASETDNTEGTDDSDSGDGEVDPQEEDTSGGSEEESVVEEEEPEPAPEEPAEVAEAEPSQEESIE